ncbi:MAG: type II toxin-antitoxin system PemK/MazF family toxin [Cyanosarcina radialis HA8281-LM2]|jgi:mRNA interferase MazF|nr:type II toxin-antitoxin system PemK/MazF family toxin [Cyanosarcina radialis HA8281-LM2]
MTTYEFGDVVLVPFPFTDQTTSQKRPAVVVSSDAYHQERSDLILMAITSQANPGSTFGEITIAQWQAAGLIKPSIIKPVLTTIDRSLVIRKLGQLQTSDCQALEKVIQAIMGR